MQFRITKWPARLGEFALSVCLVIHASLLAPPCFLFIDLDSS